jgi:hypothetical protein
MDLIPKKLATAAAGIPNAAINWKKLADSGAGAFVEAAMFIAVVGAGVLPVTRLACFI